MISNDPREPSYDSNEDDGIHELTGEADRYFDVMDLEARALGYDGAHDSDFRWHVDPRLERARVVPRTAEQRKSLEQEDDYDEETF